MVTVPITVQLSLYAGSTVYSLDTYTTHTHIRAENMLLPSAAAYRAPYMRKA